MSFKDEEHVDVTKEPQCVEDVCKLTHFLKKMTVFEVRFLVPKFARIESFDVLRASEDPQGHFGETRKKIDFFDSLTPF